MIKTNKFLLGLATVAVVVAPAVTAHATIVTVDGQKYDSETSPVIQITPENIKAEQAKADQAKAKADQAKAEAEQAKGQTKIIVQYIAYANGLNGLNVDTGDYKIHEDTIINNPSLDSSGLYQADIPNFYGYSLGDNSDGKRIIPTGGGTYYLTIRYNRIIGNDNPSKNLRVTISKNDQVRDVGYWEQKDGNWYFAQQRFTMLVGPIANEPMYYYGYSLNGVDISAKDGDFTKHYKTGPCWIKPDDNWYHLDATGKMETGWIKDGSSWYCLYSTGQMAHDVTIAGYKLGSDGALVS